MRTAHNKKKNIVAGKLSLHNAKGIKTLWYLLPNDSKLLMKKTILQPKGVDNARSSVYM